jgi:hypothetical protein
MEDNFEQEEKEEEEEKEEKEEEKEGGGGGDLPSEVRDSLPLFSDNPDIGMYKEHVRCFFLFFKSYKLVIFDNISYVTK